MSKVTNLIKKTLKSGKYLFLQPDTPEIKDLHKRFSQNKLGSFFVIDTDYGVDNDYNEHYNFVPASMLSYNINSLSAYKLPRGIVFTADTDASKKHDGIIYYLHALDNITNTDRRGNFGDYKHDLIPDIKLIEFYLLHNHNLYWNQHTQAYDLHDNRLINLCLPHFNKSQMKIRREMRQQLITHWIAGIRGLYTKFAYADMTKWRVNSGLVEQQVQQTSLFGKTKHPKHAQLLPINPSSFIHQLSAVDCTNVFSVICEYNEYHEQTTPEKNPTMNRLGKIKVNGDTECGRYTGRAKKNWHNSLWRGGRITMAQFNILFDSEYLLTNNTDAHDAPNQDVITSSPRELSRLVKFYRKLWPNGGTYTTVQFGEHLFDTTFQKLDTASSNKYPRACLPLMGYHWLIEAPDTFNGELYTNQPHAVIFGNPKDLSFTIDALGYYLHTNPMEYYDPSDSKNFCIIPNDQRVIFSMNMPKGIARKWLNGNKGYRKFIANI